MKCTPFFFSHDTDAAKQHLKSDVGDRCLSTVKNADGKVVPGLAACNSKKEKKWTVVTGDKWLNEKACECIDIDGEDLLIFSDCADAPECIMTDMPPPNAPACKAPPPAPTAGM